MTTADHFFPALSPIYLYLALGWVVLTSVVLPVLLPRHCWLFLVPSTFIHELFHALAASLLGAKVTDFEITPSSLDGRRAMGFMKYGPPSTNLLGFAETVISAAPLLGLWCASLVVHYQLSEPQGLVSGLLWLALCYSLIESAFLSWSDFKGMVMPARILYLLLWVYLLLVGASELSHLV